MPTNNDGHITRLFSNITTLATLTQGAAAKEMGIYETSAKKQLTRRLETNAYDSKRLLGYATTSRSDGRR